jgi:hypothetical protein
MSSDVLLTIGRTTPATLTEVSQNRVGLSPVYNSYVRVAADSKHAGGQRALCIALSAAVYDIVSD